jgi:hypothetical protein
LFAVCRIGQGGEIALVEAEAFGGTAKEKDAFREECERAESEDERGGGELCLRWREEPKGSGGDGENQIESGAAGMVFEIAGEVFEKELTDRHAENVAQNSKLSSGAKAQFYLRLTWEPKLPPPKEKGKGARDGPQPVHRMEPSQVWSHPKSHKETAMRMTSARRWRLHLSEKGKLT